MGSQVLLLGAVGFFASFAFAQADNSMDKIVVPAPDQTSTISTSMIPDSVMDRLFLDYFTYYHGPSLSDLKSANSIDNKGRPSARALSGLDSDVNFAYILDKERGIGLGPDVPFIAQPTQGGQFAIGDIGLKIFWKKMVKTENFRLASALYLQGATADSSIARGMDFAIKYTPYMYYDVPDSRVRLGSWLEFKWYADVKVDKILKAWASPYVSYRLSERFLLNMNYEMEAHHNVDNGPMQFISYQTDLQPGFIWWITKSTMINPYVQIFTNSPIATYNSGLGFVLYSTLM